MGRVQRRKEYSFEQEMHIAFSFLILLLPMTKFVPRRENSCGQYFIFLFKNRWFNEKQMWKARWLPWRWQTLFTMCGIKKLAERFENGCERWDDFLFSMLRWMSLSLLYLEPPPTYITSHPQAPFLEAEHLEGIEKTRHGWNNNRKPFGKTITFLEALLPHPHFFFFFFWLSMEYMYAYNQ